MTEWKKEICAELPPEFEDAGGGTVIQRRNIEQKEVEATDTMPAYTEWECESRFMEVSEYQMLKAIEEIDTAEAIDAYTEQLLEEGVL